MNKIGFKLIKINTEQFASIEDAYDSDIEDFNLDTTIGFGVDSENSAIISSAKIQFEQKEIPFLIISVSCEFQLIKDVWEEFENEQTIIFPKGFLAHLAMITIGTTRGILHAKTENTKFNEFLLPTLNVTELITEDGEFKK